MSTKARGPEHDRAQHGPGHTMARGPEIDLARYGPEETVARGPEDDKADADKRRRKRKLSRSTAGE